jgi:hypothetical protein
MHQFRIDIKNIQYAIFNANPHIIKTHTNKKSVGKQIYIVGTVFVLCATRVGGSCWSVYKYCVYKNTLKTMCAVCRRNDYGTVLKPELLNELRTEVFENWV